MSGVITLADSWEVLMRALVEVGGIGAKKSDFDKQLSLDFSGRLCSPISPEEVHWALDKVKKDAAPGSRCFGADTTEGISNVLWRWKHAP